MCPLSSHSLFLPSPQPLVTTSLLSVYMDLPIIGISYKWNHAICDLCVCLLSLSIMVLRFIRVVCISTSFFFMAEWYSTVVWATFCSFTPLMDIWIVSTFWLLWIVLLGIFVTSICFNTCFQFFDYIPRSWITRFYV